MKSKKLISEAPIAAEWHEPHFNWYSSLDNSFLVRCVSCRLIMQLFLKVSVLRKWVTLLSFWNSLIPLTLYEQIVKIFFGFGSGSGFNSSTCESIIFFGEVIIIFVWIIIKRILSFGLLRNFRSWSAWH